MCDGSLCERGRERKLYWACYCVNQLSVTYMDEFYQMCSVKWISTWNVTDTGTILPTTGLWVIICDKQWQATILHKIIPFWEKSSIENTYLVRLDFSQYGFNIFHERFHHSIGSKPKFIPSFNSLIAWSIHLTDGIRIIGHHWYQALDTFHRSIIINHQVGRPTNSLRFWTCNFWYIQSNCHTVTELIKLRVFAILSVSKTKKKSLYFK